MGKYRKKYVGISLNYNDEQIEFANAIEDNKASVIFCEGGAGTGKNFVAIAVAMQLYNKKKFDNLYYTRSHVKVGTQVDYLPADLEDGTDPFAAPLVDTLESIASKSSKKKLKSEKLLNKWEIVPMSFIRGRNLNGLILVDEAQNLSLTEIQTLCTRVAKGSKIVFIGSFKQIDNPTQKKKNICDYALTIEALKNLPYVRTVKLTKSMRSSWCTGIDDIFEQLKK